MFIEGICCRKSLFTLITSIHYITPPISIFFPMTNLFFCRNIYDPNLFFGLRSCRRRSSRLCCRNCRRLGRRSGCGFRGRFSRCSRLRGRLCCRCRRGFSCRCSCRFCCGRRLRSRAAAGRRFAHSIVAGSWASLSPTVLRLHSASILCCR